MPENCALLSCKFYAGDKKDTGGRGTYTTMTFDKRGQNLPTAYMAWGMLRNKTLESLPGYCEEEAYIGDDIMRFWLNQQLMKDPGARKYVFYYAAKLLNQMIPGEKHEQMLSDVDFILNLPDADEETLLKALEVAKDIVKDSTFLGHCVANTNRYYERISSEESYIVFLRQTDKPNRPWYTLEIEPGGTIRQKRSYSNEQYSDLQEAVPFLKEWQQVVQKRMDEKERKLAVESKEKRNKEFEELTVNGNIIHTGRYAGKLLVDELMKDLMEAAATA